MKTTISISRMLLFSILMLVMNGCEKGEDGEPGKDGSTNVTARNFPASQWSSNSSFWFIHLAVPELTTDNINSASVQVYWGKDANNWYALPYTYVAPTDYFMNYLCSIGRVEIQWDYNGVWGTIGDAPNTVLGDIKFKVVVIPPSVLKANPNLDLNNYTEVKETLHIKE